MTPSRIQRKRTKGWKMPANTISVCRPGKWGNQFIVGAPHPTENRRITQLDAVDLYTESILKYTHKTGGLADFLTDEITIKAIKTELGGKNLACWCKIGAPCHGDVLLKLANN